MNQWMAAIAPSQTSGTAPMPGTPRCHARRRFQVKAENPNVYGRKLASQLRKAALVFLLPIIAWGMLL